MNLVRIGSMAVALFAALLLPASPAPAQTIDPNVAAAQEVRIQELESENRGLTGQVEELSYQIRQLTDRMDKLIADVDFRLRSLEGGGAPVAGAAPAEGEAVPSTALDSGAPQSATTESAAAQPATPPSAGGAAQVLGTMSASDYEAQASQLNTRADPAAAAAAAGAGATSATTQAAATAPYDLPGATPDEQYQYAFALLRQTRYQDAERALRTFIERNPDHPLAGNANYWLGETYYVRSDFSNAAIVFAEGFQKYPASGKAPDNLLKLGMSLAALGETGDACTAFGELSSRYPGAAANVKDRVARERQKYGC